MNRTISVIIPCRNERSHIEACLRSVLRQEVQHAELEVIVADGVSDDGTRSILDRLAAEDPRLRVLENPLRIVSAGLNAALREARGAIIIRMDAHTDYADDYIARSVEVLRSAGADNVGGPWIARGTGLVGRAIAAAFQSPFAVGTTRGHNRDYEGLVDTVYLGCWPRDVFERVGLFDEELVRNQDDEFNLRLSRAGGRIWQSPSIKSWYTPRSSIPALFRQYLQYGYWKVRVIQKHRLPASVRHLVPAAFLLTLGVLAIASVWLPSAGALGLLLIGGYVLSTIGASLLVGLRGEWTLVPVLPFVLASFHFGYGLGFLHGLLDFVVLRRTGSRQYSALTRRCGEGRVDAAVVRDRV